MTRAAARLLRGIGSNGSLAGSEVLDDAAWHELVAIAVQHRITAIVLSRIEAAGLTQQLPPDALRRLRSAVKNATAFGLTKRAGLERVLRECNDRHLPVVLLKGAFLAHHVYTDFRYREMGDLDLLVPRDQVSVAIEALDAAGFAPAQPFSLDVDLAYGHHLTPFARAGCVVEVHWDLLAGPYQHPDFWRDVGAVRIGQAQALALSPEDMLIHVCLHATQQHGLSIGLRPLLDVDAMLADDARPLDARVLAARAAEWNAQRPVALMLALATRLLGARPIEPTEPIADDILDEAMAQLLTAGTGSTIVSENIALVFGVTGWRRRLAIAARSLRRVSIARSYGVEPESAAIHVLRMARLWNLVSRYAAPFSRAWLKPDSEFRAAERRQQLVRWLADS